MGDANLSLWGLFTSAFISSTIAPGGSEAVLAWLVSQSAISTSLLVATATVGNTLGALTTWVLGNFAEKGTSLKWGASRRSEVALERIRKWGTPALLFSWLPVVGDALCFAGGWLRLPLLRSVIAILIGKMFRYLAVAYMFL